LNKFLNEGLMQILFKESPILVYTTPCAIPP
jgi:hypothetical protein